MSLFTTQGYRYQLVAGDNVILDTFADESIKISNNITELFDIGSVPGTFTRTITLPGTKKNNAFFEQYYDISVYSPDTFNSNAKVNAYLDFGAVYLVNGYMQLMKINVIENKFVDSYEVNIFGAISNFSVDTNKLFLTDLDNLAVFNHSSSYDAITESWKGNLFSGSIIYPMADYGKRIQFSTQDWVGIDDNEDAMTVSDYKPAIRLKALWDGIFEKVGFTYTGSFFNQSWLEDVYVLLNNRGRYPEYSYAQLETYGQGKVVNILGSADNYQLTNNTQTNLPMGAKEYDNSGFFTVGNPFKYYASMPSRYLANIQLSYRVKNNGANAQSQYPAWYLYYYDANGNNINTQTLATINDYTQNVAEGRVGTPTVTENFTVTEQINIPPMTGSISFKILQQAYVASGSAGGIAVTPNYTLFLNPTGSNNYCTFEVTQVRQAADYRVMDIPSNMPFGTNGIKLVEFIRSVQKKFNLVIYEDKTTPNQMVVESFNDWYLKGQVQDFNQYINIDNKLEFIPANTLAVNKVSFNDKDDTDYVEKVFKQVNNRIYGQSFWIDTGSYFSEGEFKVETALASGPIFELPLTVASGSSVGNSCTSYYLNFGGEAGSAQVRYTNCAGSPTTESVSLANTPLYICAQYGTYPSLFGSNVSLNYNGSCTNLPDAQASSSFLPVAIPLYIGDQNYAPTQVFPRMLFNNGMVSSSQYYIEGQYSAASPMTIVANSQKTYPYFDNYNVVTGSYPTTGSRSLLFNNELATLGSTPQNSLIDTYWSTYLGLLYNPRTRLVNASAVIPLAKYFEMELNDLVQFKGNYYHLRAINDYDLTTGECMVQLLGPVIQDTVSNQLFGTATTSSAVIPCCAPSLNSLTAVSGSSVTLNYAAAGGSGSCLPCTSVLVQVSLDSVNWNTTGSANCLSSSFTLGEPTSSTYFRLITDCGGQSTTSSASNVLEFESNYLQIEYLVVAGGGGGGEATSYSPGPGGGAGGMITGSFSMLPGQFNVILGYGGAGGINSSGSRGIQRGDKGLTTILSGSQLYVAPLGGGTGEDGSGTSTNQTFAAGGSGGGTKGYYGAGGAAKIGGTGSIGQGNNGGGVDTSGYAANRQFLGASGGGGRGSAGQSLITGSALPLSSGQGGSGSIWIDGIIYAAGGGGGFLNPTSLGMSFVSGALGGSGIGGNGATSASSDNSTAATSGSIYKGSGGGGGGVRDGDYGVAYTALGASGSAGIVKIAYLGSGSKATGGTITFSGSYTYHTFTGSRDVFTYLTASTPNLNTFVDIDYVIVGGGGGGGSAGSGAGAGGFVTGSMTLITGSYAVTVGNGGIGGGISQSYAPQNGGTSSFSSMIAYGGGRGANSSSVPGDGASGGGGLRWYNSSVTGSAIYGSQGNNGNSYTTDINRNAGGGGAGSGGNNSGTSFQGGIGRFAFGSTIGFYYAAGGNGINVNGTNDYSGSGGSGGDPGYINPRSELAGGNGRDGIVIVRYYGSGSLFSGSSETTYDGRTGYTYHYFTNTTGSTLTFSEYVPPSPPPTPTGYSFISKFVSSNTITCTPTTPLVNVFMTYADEITYIANGYTLSAGLILYSSINGLAWTGGTRIYDAVNPTIWNVSAGTLTSVYSNC